MGRCGARLCYVCGSNDHHKPVTKLSGLGSRASGKLRGAGGAKETKV